MTASSKVVAHVSVEHFFQSVGVSIGSRNLDDLVSLTDRLDGVLAHVNVR